MMKYKKLTPLTSEVEKLEIYFRTIIVPFLVFTNVETKLVKYVYNCRNQTCQICLQMSKPNLSNMFTNVETKLVKYV